MTGRIAIEARAAPPAAGPYSQAIRNGPLLFCSGALPLDPQTAELVSGGLGMETDRCLQNLEAICDEAGTRLSKAVQVTVYTTELSSAPEINGAYATHFDDEPPARAMVEVKALPLGAQVEIAAIVPIE